MLRLFSVSLSRVCELRRSEFTPLGLTFLFSLMPDHNQGERGLRVEGQIRRKQAGSDGNEVSCDASWYLAGAVGAYLWSRNSWCGQ